MIFPLLAKSPRMIIAKFATDRGITVRDLKSPKRHRPIVHDRQDLMLKLWEETDMDQGEIGRRFNRDRTTVINSLRRARERRAAQ